MTLTVFCILLFAALLHASWNAIVKASGDKMYAAIGVSGSALGYTLWTFFMNGFCLLCWAMVARRREASRYLRQHWKKASSAGSAPWAPTAWRYGR